MVSGLGLQLDKTSRVTAGRDRQTFNCENGEMPAHSTAVTAGSRPLTARKDEQAQTISEWLKKQMESVEFRQKGFMYRMNT